MSALRMQCMRATRAIAEVTWLVMGIERGRLVLVTDRGNGGIGGLLADRHGASWERGEKRPSDASLKLLALVDKKGLRSIA